MFGHINAVCILLASYVNKADCHKSRAPFEVTNHSFDHSYILLVQLHQMTRPIAIRRVRLANSIHSGGIQSVGISIGRKVFMVSLLI